MKIASVTDDGEYISAHFGRAQYFMVCEVEDGRIVSRDMRAKAGHHQFAREEHDEDHHHGDDHGMGQGAKIRHATMIDTIADCEVLLTRGMGRGAYIALEEAGITPIVTEDQTVEDGVRAYLSGQIVNHTELLH